MLYPISTKTPQSTFKKYVFDALLKTSSNKFFNNELQPSTRYQSHDKIPMTDRNEWMTSQRGKIQYFKAVIWHLETSSATRSAREKKRNFGGIQSFWLIGSVTAANVSRLTMIKIFVLLNGNERYWMTYLEGVKFNGKDSEMWCAWMLCKSFYGFLPPFLLLPCPLIKFFCSINIHFWLCIRRNFLIN